MMQSDVSYSKARQIEKNERLRDEFATAAMNAMISNPGAAGVGPELIPRIAEVAYQIADAMMVARSA